MFGLIKQISGFVLTGKLNSYGVLLFIMLPLGCICLSLAVGRYPISLSEVIGIFAARIGGVSCRGFADSDGSDMGYTASPGAPGCDGRRGAGRERNRFSGNF